MTYNRKTSKRVNQICLYIAIAAIGYTVAAKMNRVKPELGVLDSLEAVETIHKGFKSILSNVD